MPIQVLFVDDEPEFVRPHIYALENMDCVVSHTETAAQAQRLLEQRSFHLIVLDLILRSGKGEETYGRDEPSPEVGLELHRAIREELGIREIPIIFLTVIQEAAVINRIKTLEQQSGARHTVLVKPKLPSRLLKEVRELTSG